MPTKQISKKEKFQPSQRLDADIRATAKESAARIWTAAFSTIQDADILRALVKGFKLLIEHEMNYQALDFLVGLYGLTDEVFPEKVFDYAAYTIVLRKFLSNFLSVTDDILMALDLAEFETAAEDLNDE